MTTKYNAADEYEIVYTDDDEEMEPVKKLYPSPNGNKIELSEQVDAVKLRYIVEHAEGFNLDKIVHDKGQNIGLEAQLSILKKYMKKVKNGRVQVTYKQSNKFGRYQANGSLSLQNISRKIRHTIAKEFYHDVDVKNAHPVMLAHYCTERGIEHSELQNYIDKRDTYFDVLRQEQGMERDAAKTLMIEIINGGNISDDMPDLVTSFYNELIAIRERVMELEPKKVKIAKKKEKEYNLEGTVVNYVMCDLENKVLMEMYNFFHSKGLKAECLCFDGLMINKKSVTLEQLEEKMLEECESYVEEQTGICIKLAVKAMDEGLELPDMKEQDSSYAAMKAKFEENNFKVITPVGFYNIEHGSIHTQNKSELVTAYQHLKYVNADGKDSSFIKDWLDDENMLHYKYVKCVPPPARCPEHTYNLWKGFAIKNVVSAPTEKDRKDFEFILEHIRLLANKDDKVYEFLIKWLAFFFQKPGEKNNIALLFKSKQGIGKDLTYTMLETMIGDFFCGNVENAKDYVFAPFNSLLYNKLLLVLNEFKGGNGFTYDGRIKDMITRKYEPIMKKGVDLIEKVPSFLHLMFFTQGEFPVKIERGDRRFFVSLITQAIPGKEYFRRMGSIVGGNEGTNLQALRLLYDHLMAIDVSKVDWINDRPMTDYMNDLLENSQDKEMTFLIKRIKEWHAEEKAEVLVPGKTFFEQFKDDLLENGCEWKHKANGFGMKVKNYNMGGFSERKINASERIRMAKLHKVWSILFKWRSVCSG
jgi:hypothetical protein